MIALLCLPFNANTVKAGPTYYYIHFRNKDGSQIANLPDNMNDILAGTSFKDAFKYYQYNYPELEDTENKMTVWTLDKAGSTPIFLEDKINSNVTLYRQTYKPVNEVNLTFKPPVIGEYGTVTPNVSIVGPANYTITSVAFLENRDDQVPFTGKFQEGKIYWLDVSVRGKNGFAMNGFTRILTVLIDGAEVYYDMNFGLGVNIKYPISLDNNVQAFIRRMYEECLDRNPDSMGFNFWYGMLKISQEPATTLVHGFFNSPEFLAHNYKDGPFLDKCYKALFDRAADAPGKKLWLEYLANGVSRNYVLAGFVGSKEYIDLCNKFGIVPGTIKLTEPRDQNYGITSFVARCYTKALDRSFDVPGLNSWCKTILAASNKKEEAIKTASDGFFHSAEFKNHNYSNEEYLKRLYRTFLNREPDPEGFNDWLNYLKNGMSRDQVLYGFAYSTEFAKIMAKYGL
ncbi:MAG: DUF4214 domain-containing protein [Solobacterium sp.]|nr:DUF4214 domain-containing protein [Solobacterium sp.]